MKIIPVILSGGCGSRLWPLSRSHYPKQFMVINENTLFENTLKRAASIVESCAPVIVCNNEHRFFVANALLQNEMGGTMILEPTAKNTAPAIALAAFYALEHDPDALLLVLSADHIIEPLEPFKKAIENAIPYALNNALITFGVSPTRPETGFGYIKRGLCQDNVYKIDSFEEKPSASRAVEILKNKDYYWNAGIFLFKPAVYLDELNKFNPDIKSCCHNSWQNRELGHGYIKINKEDFDACPAKSIDYAVMEQTQIAFVVPMDATWNDLGSWSAFYHTSPHDNNANACIGDVVDIGSKNCYIHSTHRLVATIGLENLAIIESSDAVLISHKDKTQDVKLITQQLKKLNRIETQSHTTVYRPWGTYEILAQGQGFQVKRIIVTVGHILSLQLHHHRTEHWVVVRGVAKVTLDDKDITLNKDQSTYIPVLTKHRLENIGETPLEIIEIQSGNYLGEDDIVRFEDTYGRS